MIKKYIMYFVLFISLFIFTGCTKKDNEDINKIPPETTTTNSKILITYFTWADNTHVEDVSSVNPDLSTSASLLPPGNAEIVASFIKDAVGGEMFSIVVLESYSSDYDECLDRAANEKASNARPQIVNKVENIENYDIIFLGYPNWWYTVPMAIFSFIESYDLSGKTVIPFCVHGTGGLASSVRDIAKSLPSDVTFITNAFGVYRPDTKGCREDVNKWLIELGFEVNK